MKSMMRRINFHGFTFKVKPQKGASEKDAREDYLTSVRTFDTLWAEHQRVAKIGSTDLKKLQDDHRWPDFLADAWEEYSTELEAPKIRGVSEEQAAKVEKIKM